MRPAHSLQAVKRDTWKVEPANSQTITNNQEQFNYLQNSRGF